MRKSQSRCSRPRTKYRPPRWISRLTRISDLTKFFAIFAIHQCPTSQQSIELFYRLLRKYPVTRLTTSHRLHNEGWDAWLEDFALAKNITVNGVLCRKRPGWFDAYLVGRHDRISLSRFGQETLLEMRRKAIKRGDIRAKDYPLDKLRPKMGVTPKARAS